MSARTRSDENAWDFVETRGQGCPRSNLVWATRPGYWYEGSADLWSALTLNKPARELKAYSRLKKLSRKAGCKPALRSNDKDAHLRFSELLNKIYGGCLLV